MSDGDDMSLGLEATVLSPSLTNPGDDGVGQWVRFWILLVKICLKIGSDFYLNSTFLLELFLVEF